MPKHAVATKSRMVPGMEAALLGIPQSLVCTANVPITVRSAKQLVNPTAPHTMRGLRPSTSITIQAIVMSRKYDI